MSPIKDGIELTYIYSACVISKTKDVTVLHDPWFSEGAYDGSWYHFPKIINPLDIIGNIDLIYISHIHPDHYDPVFLREYFSRYGEKEIIIADYAKNYLYTKMKGDGFTPTVLKDTLRFGNTSIDIHPHITNGDSDIDSALVLKYESKERTHCLVNANDVVFDRLFREKIKRHAGEIDIYLGSYAAAGPYPQTYFESNDSMIYIESERVRNNLLSIYKTDVNFFNSKVNIPFAGKYILGGRLAKLNKFLPITDPISVCEFDNRAVILADGGGKISTLDYFPSDVRVAKYSDASIIERINEIKFELMDYEKLISMDEIDQLPIKRLLRRAAKNAIAKSEIEKKYYFAIQLQSFEYAVIEASKDGNSDIIFTNDISQYIPRSEIYIDMRHLFGLLTHIYHWNNAEVGSHYNTKRVPNIFNRNVQNFLNFLTL
jgi:UDP-MurNAc hydroxylase